MLRFYTITALFLFTLTAFTQQKLISIEEAVIGQWRELYPEYLHNLQWRGDSKNITFQDKNTIYQQTIGKSDSINIISLAELNKLITRQGYDSVSFFPSIKWENQNYFHFYNENTWFCFSMENRTFEFIISLPKTAENRTLHFATKQIAYTVDNNLFVNDTSKHTLVLSNENDNQIVFGQSVSRNEFGIDGGIFWSPNGSKIAFYRKDERKVKNYPLVDITAREAELENIKYPMAGMASEHISVGVYSFDTKNTIYIEKNDTLSEKYLTNVSWDPNGENLFIQVLNRAQNHMQMNKYSISDGALSKTLFEEKHDKYVEPHAPIVFIPNQPNNFIYQTRTNGYNHAYVYNTSGKLLKQVTSGNWEITKLLDIDKNYIYYISTKESAIERHFYKTHLNSGKTTKLTNTAGVHSVKLNKNNKYFIDNYSNTQTPRVINITSTSGKIIRQVLNANNPLEAYNIPNIKIGTIKAADDNTDLYYRLITPANYDSTKKYPAIIYVYGGPHAQLITNKWLGGSRLWNYMMAQKGYVMLTIDNRGSANRGLEFENIIHRQCGVTESKDQLKGIELLKNMKNIDMSRIGIFGWSYGGFMSTTLMTNYPETFKVGVAGGPVIDWKYYEVMYGERYMDTPEENPDGYLYTSLLPRAKNLQGKHLIIHGAVDPVVVMQHSQQFVRECIKNRVPVDYFIYPRAEHNVRGYDRIHLMDKITRYFDDNL